MMDCYDIPRTPLKELRESKFSRIMESVSPAGNHGKILKTSPEWGPMLANIGRGESF